MGIEIIKIQNEQQWLERRVFDVTSTESPALFNLSPYLTEFELFHNKRDAIVVKLQPSERMRWGNRLESAIAHGAAEDQGWSISKLDVYMSDLDIRMGSSFDFQIDSSSDGPGIMEIKNVDRLEFARNWIDHGNGQIEAPEHIEMQVQHQMAVSGHKWCAIVALVGGNEQKVLLRNADAEIAQGIRDKVQAFWKRVADNTPPSADYSRDAEFIIKKLYGKSDEGVVLDATNDPDLEDMLTQYRFVSKELGDMEKIKDRHKAKILERIGRASKVLTSIGTLSCGNVKDSAPTVITPDMIGKTYGGRAGYRAFKFNPAKEK